MSDECRETIESRAVLAGLSNLVKQSADKWIATFSGGAVLGPGRKIQAIRIFTPGFDSPICQFFQRHQGEVLKAIKDTNEMLTEKRLEKISPNKNIIQEENQPKVITAGVGGTQQKQPCLTPGGGVLVRNIKVSKIPQNKTNVAESKESPSDFIKAELVADVDDIKQEYCDPDDVEMVDTNILQNEQEIKSDLNCNASEEIITGDLDSVIVHDDVKEEIEESDNKTMSDLLEDPNEWVRVEGAPYKIVSRLEEALFFPDKVELWQNPNPGEYLSFRDACKDKSVLYRGNWMTPVAFAENTGSSVSLESISVAYECMKLDRLLKRPKQILQEVYIERGTENDPDAPIFKVIRTNRAMVAKILPDSAEKLGPNHGIYDPDTQKIEVRGLHRHLVFAKNIFQVQETNDKTGKVKVMWIRFMDDPVRTNKTDKNLSSNLKLTSAIPKGHPTKMVPLRNAPYKVKCNSLEGLFYQNKILPGMFQQQSMALFIKRTMTSTECIMHKSKWMTPQEFKNLAGSEDVFVVFEGVKLEEFLMNPEDQRHITFFVEKGTESSPNALLCKFSNVKKTKRMGEKVKELIWKYGPISKKSSNKSHYVKYHPDSKVIHRVDSSELGHHVKANDVYQVQKVDPVFGTVEIEWIRCFNSNGTDDSLNIENDSEDSINVVEMNPDAVVISGKTDAAVSSAKHDVVVVMNPEHDDFSESEDEDLVNIAKRQANLKRNQKSNAKTNSQKSDKTHTVQTFPMDDAPYKIVLGNNAGIGAKQGLLFKNKSIPWSQTHLYRCVLFKTEWITIDQFMDNKGKSEVCFVVNEFGKLKLRLDNFLKKQPSRDFFISEERIHDPNAPIYRYSNMRKNEVVMYPPVNATDTSKVNFGPNFLKVIQLVGKNLNLVKAEDMFQKHSVHALSGHISIEWIRHVKIQEEEETYELSSEETQSEQLPKFSMETGAKIIPLKDSPDLITFNLKFAWIYYPKSFKKVYFNGESLTLQQFYKEIKGQGAQIFFQSTSFDKYLQNPIEKKFFVKSNERNLPTAVLYSLKGESECWEYEPDVYQDQIVGFKERLAVERPKRWEEYEEAKHTYQIHKDQTDGYIDLQWIRVITDHQTSLDVDVVEELVKGNNGTKAVINFDVHEDINVGEKEVEVEDIKLEPEDGWDSSAKRKFLVDDESTSSTKKCRQKE